MFFAKTGHKDQTYANSLSLIGNLNLGVTVQHTLGKKEFCTCRRRKAPVSTQKALVQGNNLCRYS